MKRTRFIISLVTAALLFSGVLWISGVHPKEVIDLLKRCDLPLLGYALIAYTMIYFGRAVRFSLLLQEKSPPFPGLLCTVTLHNLFNAVLPARAGELSYVYLLRKRFSISVASGVSTLVVARVLDLLCLVLFFGVGLVYYQSRIEKATPGMIVACFVILIVGVALLLNLPGLANLGLKVFMKLAKAIGLEKKRFVELIASKAQEVVEAFRTLKSRLLLLIAFVLSLLVWFLTYLTCYWILLSFNVVSAQEISFGLSIVGTTALHATCILPINSFANLGTWEAGWGAGYIFLGMDKELAVQTGLGEHLIVFSFLLVLGTLGWIGLQWLAPKQKE